MFVGPFAPQEFFKDCFNVPFGALFWVSLIYKAHVGSNVLSMSC